MKAPKGMVWINITYLTDRIDEERMDGVFRGEACMTELVDSGIADCLLYGGDIADIYKPYVTAMIRAREKLCFGRYVEDTMVISEEKKQEV